MIRWPAGAFLAALVLACSAGIAAAADVEGSRDHDLVGRYEGSQIAAYKVTEFDEVTLVDGPFDPARSETRTGPGFETLEGRSFLIYYRLPEGRSTLEVLRSYEASLKAKGFAVLFTCATSDGSCFGNKAPDAGYYLGRAVGDPLSLPRLDGDYVHNWFEQRGRYLLARLERAGGAATVSVSLGESSVGSVAVVRVIESKPMDAGKITALDAGRMEKAIAETGKVSVYGILFDFDQDSLRPESKPTLDEIAKLLEAKPQLRLSIVGHTDNVGPADYNLDLSRRRAESVVAALIGSYGIDPQRLAASGAGPTSPVADNATEEGRAKNRRVELVAQ